jgi:DNA polymerase (family X)
MENDTIVKALSDLADLLEMDREPGFRVRAFRNAARAIEGLGEPAEVLLAAGKLTKVPGIGDGIARRVNELITEGSLGELEERRARMPPGLVDLLRLPGLGPKSAEVIWRELKLSTLLEVEEAARAGRLRGLPRFGAVREQRLLAAIEARRHERPRIKLSQALESARRLVARMRETEGVVHSEACGSVRRHLATIGDLDVLVACPDAARAAAIERFVTFPDVVHVLNRGETKTRVMLRDGLEVDLVVVPPESWGAALHYLTGSQDHNVAMRSMAAKRKLRINEYGVYEDREGERRIGGAEEMDVFAALGLPWIPPELREGKGEIEAALAGKLPRLIERADMRGDLHMHTTETDGKSSLEEMVAAAAEAGHEYLAITDHSQALAITKGLDPMRLRLQGVQIRALNDKLGGKPTILRGIEADILADGSVDLGAEVLGELDWVVGSVHSAFRLSREEQTKRVVRALESGLIDVLGHPTGRLLTRRDPYPIDIEQVLAAAKRVGAAVELNAFPDRLDLEEGSLRMAKEMGVPVIISTDSHERRQLERHMPFGVGIARRGWLEPGDVGNTWPLETLLDRFPRRRRPSAAL